MVHFWPLFKAALQLFYVLCDFYTSFSLGRFTNRRQFIQAPGLSSVPSRGSAAVTPKQSGSRVPSVFLGCRHISVQTNIWEKELLQGEFQLPSTWVVWGLFQLIAADWPVSEDRCQGGFCWLFLEGSAYPLLWRLRRLGALSSCGPVTLSKSSHEL